MIGKTQIAIGVASMVLLCHCAPSKGTDYTQDNNTGKGTLVWSDEFDSSELDTTRWTTIIGDGCPENCGFGNNELQYYTDSHRNLVITDGKLRLIALKDSAGNKAYSSVKLVSKNKGDWQYGRFDIKAKLPQGKGTWPAIWMMPTLERPTRWPQDGEIDIMEHVGYNMGTVHGTIHTEKYNHNLGTHKSDSVFVEDAHVQFHEYSLVWTKDSMTWLLDDKPFLTLHKGDNTTEGWPFDGTFHLILNLAVGGHWGGKLGIDDSIWPQAIEIEYVRVYQKMDVDAYD